jgi:phosphate acetyltransferase
MPSTIDAAALCKMADRGQITGALLDGPLAMDNAIDPEAAAIKHLVSPVAGRPMCWWRRIWRPAICWPRA